MIMDITEYSTLAREGSGSHVMTGQEPCVRNQQIVISGSSTRSLAFDETTRFIRVHTDTACRVAVGSNPTAASTSMRMSAGGTEYLGVSGGLKLAVISSI